eukprot:TRINITY_DN3794_c0_g1_i5.p1 TRINITY_DN3794_c0_g1~~TRINITY_DN3794_c0_g1_i5.p1  ORF type:complete len:269 (+),score=65.60 TRINITY_DN3794_c0_g1_i5:96-902(+)
MLGELEEHLRGFDITKPFTLQRKKPKFPSLAASPQSHTKPLATSPAKPFNSPRPHDSSLEYFVSLLLKFNAVNGIAALPQEKKECEVLGKRIVRLVKELLKRKGIACEKVLECWGRSLDPCKSLILLLLKSGGYGKEGSAGSRNEAKKMSRTEYTKNSKAFDEDGNVWNDENIEFQSSQGLLKSVWTRQTEKVYNNYKKQFAILHKSREHAQPETWRHKGDLAGLWKATRDNLRTASKSNWPKLVSLKGLQEVTPSGRSSIWMRGEAG